MELYRQIRPARLKDVIGQDAVIQSIQSSIIKRKLPHSLLFYGASGCGKTTTGRIVAKLSKCVPSNLHEINAGTQGGIDTIRRIEKDKNMKPLEGKSVFWLIDEAHKLSKAAQDGLLKVSEECPEHLYIILCTTAKTGLIRTIITRFREYHFKPLSSEDTQTIIDATCKKVDIKMPIEVLDKIIEVSDGSARKALVLLESIIDSANDNIDIDISLELIGNLDAESQTIDLCRALLNKKNNWKSIAKILKDLEKEEPESIRWAVLGYMRSVLLSGGQAATVAHTCICVMKDNFYDSKHAGLVAACYELLHMD